MSYIVKRGKNGSGKQQWLARYQVGGRTKSKMFNREVDARRFLSTVEADLLRGNYVDPRLARQNFGAWAEQFTSSTAIRLDDSTAARNDWLLRSLVLPTFADYALGQVQPSTVQAWVASLSSRYGHDSVTKAYQLVGRIFDGAVESGLLARSPCRGIDLPKSQSREKRFLSPAQVDELAEAINPRYGLWVLTAAYTGLRWGELAALRKDHVDFLRRRVTVQEALSDVRGHLRFGPPKTKASRRTVSLPAFLVDELASYVTRDTDLIFTTPDGLPLRASNFRRRVWLPAVLASVGEPCTPHDLRHTHAAMLVKAGAHPKAMQGRLGHTSIKTTLDTYGHLYEGIDEAIAESLETLRPNGIPKSNVMAVASKFPPR